MTPPPLTHHDDLANPRPPFTPIPNELLEKFARLDPQLSGYQWRILCVIMRETWGYEEFKDGPRRQKHKIAITTFQKKTDLDRRHIHRTLKELFARNIIAKIGNGNSIIYGIQKDYSKWIPLPKSAHAKRGKKRAEIGNDALPELATKALPELATYKERKENLKESEAPPEILKSQGASPYTGTDDGMTSICSRCGKTAETVLTSGEHLCIRCFKKGDSPPVSQFTEGIGRHLNA